MFETSLFYEKPACRLICLSSGSNGNCYYIGTSKQGILIDAGVGPRNLKKYFFQYGIAPETLQAVFLTHDHADHAKTAAHCANKLHLPVYATEKVHEGIDLNDNLKKCDRASRRYIEKESPIELAGFSITAFEVPHDSAENVGYKIDFGYHTVVIVTDVGHITATIRRYAEQAQHLVIETNYDPFMLAAGRYPESLKKRIAGGWGHLSNEQAGSFVASIYSARLREVWLCHISADNNRPQLAFDAVDRCLKATDPEYGRRLTLKTLARGKPSHCANFESAGR